MTFAEYNAQCRRNMEKRHQHEAQEAAANHYNGQQALANPLQGYQNAQQAIAPLLRVAGATHKPAVYDSSDALLGELLREVLSMAKAMEVLRGEVADLRAEIRDKGQAQVLTFPATALRHGTPR